ncbi:MAG: 5-oxoprolinase subunit PxpB [Deltaproteobacteria bacterium]|nr:5-oxoprolinase subunit PxpB [Deltaproteobacteria bacterium]
MHARGDAAIALVLTAPFSLRQHRRLLALLERIDATKPVDVLDVVPGHNEILVLFDPGTPARDIELWLWGLARASAADGAPQNVSSIRIPVCFDPPFGLDLAAVATQLSMTETQVVQAFTKPTYECTVVGFRPGFPYLEGLPNELVLPRHASPRARVPRGSVAIAGGQAGIYPVDGPGGWRIIGQTNVALFDLTQSPPCLITPGTRVQFYGVDRNALVQGTL